MDLVIKEEFYKVKVGAEVFSIRYPALDELESISDDMKSAQDEGGKAPIGVMKKWLEELGLDLKFFKLPGVNASHVLKVWEGINGLKK